MPVAQNSLDETQKFDLTSCPPDGYVVLRRLSYGEIIKRRALTKLSMAMEKGQKDFKGEMAMASIEINQFEYTKCIIDHNLEKLDGTKFNFNSANDLNLLDPRIGQEIEMFMNKMNNFEEDEGE